MAVEPLPCPAESAGHRGAIEPQQYGDLRNIHPLIVVEREHLPLPGRQLPDPGLAQIPPQPLQPFAVVGAVFPQPHRHVADPLAGAGIKACIVHVCDSSCHNSVRSKPPAPASPAAAASALRSAAAGPGPLQGPSAPWHRPEAAPSVRGCGLRSRHRARTVPKVSFFGLLSPRLPVRSQLRPGKCGETAAADPAAVADPIVLALCDLLSAQGTENLPPSGTASQMQQQKSLPKEKTKKC